MVEYKVERRKGRKNLVLTVDMDGNCIVKAPWRCTNDRIERFVKKEENWIIAKQKEKSELPRYRLTEEKIEELRAKAKAIVPAKIYYYCMVMGIEVPDKIAITSAKKRWGSCSANRHIRISLYLMLYPEEAIDYVIVHEIAHLKELNHSKAFWAIVESVLPDYKERKALLK